MGMMALAFAKVTIILIVLVFAVFCITEGLLMVIGAFVAGGGVKQWWSVFCEGSVCILVGGVTFAVPVAAVYALPFLIAFRAILAGLFEIVWAAGFRKVLSGRLFFSLPAFLSILLGLVTMALPRSGVLAVAWPLGSYGVFFGAALIAVASYLKASDDQQPS